MYAGRSNFKKGKMKNTLYTILFGLLMLFAACESLVTDFELEEKAPKIVVNAILDPDSTVLVNVSKSLRAGDKNELAFVTGAQVKLFENGIDQGNLTDQGGGYYVLNSFQPQIGNDYRLEVNAPGFEKAVSVLGIPDKPVVLNVDTTTILDYSDDYCVGCPPYRAMNFSFEISDDENEEDFYMMELKRTVKEYIYDEVEVNDPYYGMIISYEIVDSTVFERNSYLSMNSTVPEYVEDYNWFYRVTPDWIPTGTSYFFSDKKFSGSNVNISFILDPNWETFQPEFPEVKLVVSRISESYYNYIRSMAIIDEVGDNPLAEPAMAYSNIDNGYGIFTAKSSQVFTFDLSEFILSMQGDY